MFEKINCRECGTAFFPVRAAQTFCQTKCRKDFNNREDRAEMKAARLLAQRDDIAYLAAHPEGPCKKPKEKFTLADLHFAPVQPAQPAEPTIEVEVHRRKLVASVR